MRDGSWHKSMRPRAPLAAGAASRAEQPNKRAHERQQAHTRTRERGTSNTKRARTKTGDAEQASQAKHEEDDADRGARRSVAATALGAGHDEHHVGRWLAKAAASPMNALGSDFALGGLDGGVTVHVPRDVASWDVCLDALVEKGVLLHNTAVCSMQGRVAQFLGS